MASALDLTGLLVAMAKDARFQRCAVCEHTTPVFPSPTTLLNYIAQHWHDRSIVISVEGPHEDMRLWADIHGFISTEASTARSAVALDSGRCSDTMMGRLSALARSLWLIPDATFVCLDGSSKVTLNRYGWCQTCQRGYQPPRWEVATRAISRGHERELSSEPELDRILLDGVTLRDILARPVESFAGTTIEELRSSAEICAEFGVGHLALGTPIRSLTARELALLSLIKSAQEWGLRGGVVIIDLPRGLSGGDSGSALATGIEKITGQYPSVICSSGLFDCKAIEHNTGEVFSNSGKAIPSLGTLSLSQPLATPLIVELSRRVTVRQASFPKINLWSELHAALQSSEGTNRGVITAQIQRAFQLFPVSVFQPRRYTGAIVARHIGLMEALSNLFAASLDAKSRGLTAKDFAIDRARKNPCLCSECGGLGVLLEHIEELPRPIASPCHICQGQRYTATVHKTLFKGTSLPEMLNRPIADSLETLRALPKVSKVLDLIITMDLGHLPLGMPIELLSDSELRALELVIALARATPSNPSLILLEEPNLFLSAQQLANWSVIFNQAAELGKAYVIEVTA